MRPLQQRFILIFFGWVWLTACAGGTAVLFHYNLTPGTAGKAPAQWPAAGPLALFPGTDTLVMAVHPRCPCTRASLMELNELMLSLQGRLKAYVLVVKPAGVPQGWEDTDILSSAKRVPGVIVKIDPEGLEASRLGAETSGQAILFDPQGRLLFNGGITESRGHVGDNEGLRRIIAWVKTGTADKNGSLVFGCSLQSKTCPREKAGL